jgi:pimeloyl-ACP methyl ester carboxylesterase
MTLHPGKGLAEATLSTPDGRALRYVTAGEGAPVVVFEAGLGSNASMWVLTQRLVSAVTTTVAYDRAGHAGSTPDTQARSLTRICEDLDLLVQRLSPDQPVVLVAHSWGGPIVRCYADLHPDRVAGVVLVDTSTTKNFPPKAAKRMPSLMTFMRVLHVLGVAKPMLRKTVFKNLGPEVSPDDRAVIDRDLTSKRSAKAAVGEAKAILSSLPLMARWEEAGLPDVPVINVMGGGTGRGAALRAKYIADVEKEMANHPQGECRVIEGTDHYVPQDKPRETAQAILDVVERARHGS